MFATSSGAHPREQPPGNVHGIQGKPISGMQARTRFIHCGIGYLVKKRFGFSTVMASMSRCDTPICCR
jgi:hypothetical protein